MGHEQEKFLSNLTVSASKYYCIATKQGEMMLMGQDSKKLLFDLKMNGSCSAVAFSKDEKIMYSVGDQAEIYQWDLSMRKCIGRVQDTGAYNTTELALSPNGSLLATGSKMGCINLYHIDSGMTIAETPFKTILNLTTAITDLEFNHTGELLAFSSKW
jgi:U3 small nucleolar RNA-associated protein 18